MNWLPGLDVLVKPFLEGQAQTLASLARLELHLTKVISLLEEILDTLSNTGNPYGQN